MAPTGKSYRTADERQGYLSVITGDSTYTLRRAEYEPLKLALAAHRRAERSGDPDLARDAEHWFEGEDNHGAVVLIDLAFVESIVDFGPAALARKDHDQQLLSFRPDTSE